MESAGLYTPDIAHKRAELAELKCKMIFRLLCITEIPPLNHETVIVYIKAEDIIFCFYLF